MGRLELLLVTGALALFAASCAGGTDPADDVAAPEGPAEIRVEVVEDHAAQFDDDLRDRAAGSQQEFAAATYITAHLQRAGYNVALRSVPFEDLVRSTNVVALAPRGGDPTSVVMVPYDSTPSSPSLGRDIGLFLELARAARVADPDHGVQFVALAAELTSTGGGNLGSRAVASEVAGLDDKPHVISLVEVPGEGFRASGSGGDDLNEIAESLGIALADPPAEPALAAHLGASELFTEAGIAHAVAAGGVEEIGEVMLAYLQASAR